jgi:hypothetical protein
MGGRIGGWEERRTEDFYQATKENNTQAQGQRQQGKERWLF